MFAVSPKLDCPHVQALLGDISAGSAAADLRRFIATDPVLAFFPTQQHTLTQLQSETQSQTQRVAQTDNSAAGLSVPVPLEIQQGRLLGLVGPPCSVCGDAEENWLCLKCCQVFCSFYRSQHMAQHYDSAGHGLCLSLSDGSFWCNDCQSYVFSPDLRTLAVAFSDRKFSAQTLNAIAEADEGDEDASPAEQSQQRIGAAVNALARQVDQQLTIEHSQAPTPAEESVPSNFHDTEIGFTYQQLIRGLREKVFKRVVFLTGAGISVAAGIPDFRTPGTGLYSRVQELGLPYPEAIFSLDYLRERPIAFFRMAKGFLNYKASPVLAHKFMARMDREQQLLKVMTQNIDGLELDAGLQLDKLSQAHGHMRSARCISCRAEHSIDKFFEFVENEKVMYCGKTLTGLQSLFSFADEQQTCAGIVKPDIVFFGESLPSDFFDGFSTIAHADLVIVMGTSLKVQPFASLLDSVSRFTPVFMLNRELPGVTDSSSDDEDGDNGSGQKSNDQEKEQVDNWNGIRRFLFLKGDIEASIARIAEDINWEL